MSWERLERTPPTPEYWDETYKDEGKWITPKPDIQQREREALELMKPLTNGMRVLDLGGGPLLAATLERMKVHHLMVDHSRAACDLAKAIAPAMYTKVADVREFLNGNKERFDTTVSMGVLMYLRADALDELFRLAPSNVLVVNEPISEGYLDYQTRITIHSLKEYLETAVKYGWILTRRVGSMEHLFARFERRNGN